MLSSRAMTFQEAADTVKASLDIVEMVSRAVALKQRGRNHLGLCPFHQEKTPSFNVNREKNLFKCFGCGEGGDALAFLMKYENKTYGEVIRELAAEQGIVIQDMPGSGEAAAQRMDLEKKILTLNEAALAWFESQLKASGGEAVRGYLQNRGMHAEAIQRFQLGFAPPGWENLTHFLFAEPSLSFLSANPGLLVTAGLAGSKLEEVNQVGKDQCYDRFRNRLVIPIHDAQGRVVGFGGRALSPEDTPKYLNSPETPVYIKNRILYGLYQGREAIRQSKSVIVMEGYFDVISAQMAGVETAVATCGTALTEQHLKLLQRFSVETLYLAFDADEAGIKAALSAIERIEPNLNRLPLKVKVVMVPDGKDPDEFFQAHGPAGADAFRQLLATAPDALVFKLEIALRGLDVHTSEGRVEAAGRLAPLLAAIERPVLQAELIRHYAHRLGVGEEALRLEVARCRKGGSPPGSGLPYGQKYAAPYGQRSAPFEASRPPFRKETFQGGARGATFNRLSPSYKRKGSAFPEPRIPYGLEPVADLNRPLIPRHMAAERALLSLTLMNDESYQTMEPLLLNLSFVDNSCQRILEMIQRLATPLKGSVDAVDALVQHLSEAAHTDSQGSLQPLLADIVFQADAFYEQLRLAGLPGPVRQKTVLQEANKFIAILEAHRQQQTGLALAERVRQLEQARRQSVDGVDETPLLELQYQLRDHLDASQTKPPPPPSSLSPSS